MLGNVPLQILERRIKDGHKFQIVTEFSIRADEPVHAQVAKWAAGKAIKGEHVRSTGKRTSIERASVNVRERYRRCGLPSLQSHDALCVSLVTEGTVVRRTVDSKASPVCSESSCQLCNVAGASVDGTCSCGQCSDSECLGHADGTSFVFEGKAPACSACAHEPSVVPDGEVVPGEITDTGEALKDSLDGNLVAEAAALDELLDGNR